MDPKPDRVHADATTGHRLVLAALWLACAASCACVVLFPWWRDHVGGYMWPLGVATGWLAHGGWTKRLAARR